MSELYPCKKTVTREEYLQIVGLLKLAEHHNATLKSIANAVDDLLGSKRGDGHGCDATYCDYTADHLLELMEVTVEKE